MCARGAGAICLIAGGWAAAAQLRPESVLLERIRQKAAENLSRAPNYTCVQTIERSQRPAGEKNFVTLDRVRVEVALVEGKELFSWPGANRFEDKSLRELVGGTTTTGDYAMHAHAVFRTPAPAFHPGGEETLGDRRMIRYHYRIPQQASGYRIHVGDREAVAGYHGSIWADRETLELTRLLIEVDEVPAELALASARTVIDYSKVRVGTSLFLLPQRVEFTMRRADGSESRNHTQFTGCRQYVGQFEISFTDPTEPRAAAAEDPVAEMELPAGLELETRLETPIDSDRAAVGDPITARLAWAAKWRGREMVPKGAILSGRIHRLERPGGRAPYFVIGLEFRQLVFGNQRARFRGQLQAVGPIPGVPARQMMPLPQQEAGVGVFVLRGTSLRLPRGARLAWRILE